MEKYELRKYNEREYGIYDTEKEKFIQKGSLKVMQAALQDLRNGKLDPEKQFKELVNGFATSLKKESREIKTESNWCGIDGIKHIWNGSWSDPQIEYNGNIYNEWDVQEYVGDAFNESEEGKGLEDGSKDWHTEFTKWCKENADWVKSMIEELTPDKKVNENKESKLESKLVESNGTDVAAEAIMKYTSDGGKTLDQEWLNNEIQLLVDNTRNLTDDLEHSKRPSHSIAYDGLLLAINSKVDKDLTSRQVQAGFKKLGLDFKEVIKPSVEYVEERRKELKEESKEETYYYELHFDFTEDSEKDSDGYSKFFKSDKNVEDDVEEIWNLAVEENQIDDYDDISDVDYAQQIDENEYNNAMGIKEESKESKTESLSNDESNDGNNLMNKLYQAEIKTEFGKKLKEKLYNILLDEMKAKNDKVEEPKEKKTEEIEYWTQEMLDEIDDDYKTTVGETIRTAGLRGEDEEATRKLYKDLGYDESDPMVQVMTDKGSTLKPIKIKKESKEVKTVLSNLKATSFQELREEIDKLLEDEIINEEYEDFLDIISDQEEACEDYIRRRSDVTNTDYADELGIEEDYVKTAIQNIIETLNESKEIKTESKNEYDREFLEYLLREVEINRDGEVIYIPDFEDAETYKDLTQEEYNKSINYLKSLIEKADFYESDGELYIQLNDNHTFWEIDNGNIDFEFIDDYLKPYFDAFEENTGVELWQAGRSGRHIVVKLTLDNLERYDELKQEQEKQEKAFIEEMNSYGKEEESKEVKTESEFANEDLLNDFTQYVANNYKEIKNGVYEVEVPKELGYDKVLNKEMLKKAYMKVKELFNLANGNTSIIFESKELDEDCTQAGDISGKIDTFTQKPKKKELNEDKKEESLDEYEKPYLTDTETTIKEEAYIVNETGVKENESENIINPEDKDYYDSQFIVSLYPGAGVEYVTYKVYADYEEQALDIAVAFAEDNAPGLLINCDSINPEEEEDLIYVDATEYGASQPYYVSYETKVQEDTKLTEDIDEEDVEGEPEQYSEEDKREKEIFDQMKNEKEEKTAFDYFQDRIGVQMSVGELNEIIQSTLGRYQESFLRVDELYNADFTEPQELVIMDDGDTYILTYNIIDLDNAIIEITDVDMD